MTVNGTIQDVVREIRKVDPLWNGALSNTTEPESATSRKRRGADFSASTVACKDSSHPYGHAIVRRIKEGIRYLRRVNGQPHHDAGPDRCGRVSCSYNSAIWWCNNVSRVPCD